MSERRCCWVVCWRVPDEEEDDPNVLEPEELPPERQVTLTLEGLVMLKCLILALLNALDIVEIQTKDFNQKLLI